jgi:hypothetical protein
MENSSQKGKSNLFSKKKKRKLKLTRNKRSITPDAFVQTLSDIVCLKKSILILKCSGNWPIIPQVFFYIYIG